MSSHNTRSSGTLVKFVSAPCGAGKSYAVCKLIAGTIERPVNKISSSHLYVAPTIKLLHEVAEQLKKLGIHPIVITSDTHPKNTISTVVGAIRDLGQKGAVLLITHNAYLALPYFHQKHHWQVWIDEVPQVDCYYDRRLPRGHHLLTSYLEPSHRLGERIIVLKPKDEGALRRYLEKPIDDMEESVRNILVQAASPNWDVMVDTEAWTRIVERGCASKEDDENRLPILSMLNTTAFANTTILSAHFENTLLYHWLKRLGAFIQPDTSLMEHLRYTEYPTSVSERVRVSYILDGRSYSKSLAAKEVGDFSVADHLDTEIRAVLRDRKFLLAVNNDYPGALTTLPGATRISTVPHGLNSFQDHNLIVFLAALNRKPQHIRLLVSLGLTSQQIRVATGYEALHQCVMRTALRDPSSKAVVEVIVPDRFAADFLVHIFGEIQVCKLGELNYQTKTPYTPVERNRRSKFESFKKQVMQPAAPNLLQSSIESYKKSHQTAPSGNPIIVVTSHSNVRAYMTSDFHAKSLGLSELRKWLRRSSNVILKSKEENLLFNLTEFDPTRDPNGFRRQTNFVRSYGLVLDFDNGTLSPEKFIENFWSRAGLLERRSFIIANSFSRSAAQPNRFRVILPFIQPAQSLNEFQAVFDSIAERLEGAGFPSKACKLDPNCRNGIQSFYLPCINREVPEWALYKEFGLKRSSEFLRYGIDPTNYAHLGTCDDALLWCRSPSSHTILGAEDIEARKERVLRELERKYAGMREGRHVPILSAANALAHASFTAWEINNHLGSLFGQEPSIEKQIRETIRKLEKEGLISY